MYWNESITVLKVDNYMPRTTDLEGSKTEDSCDPWLEKPIKTSQTKICQTLLQENSNPTNSAFFKAWSPKQLQRGRRDNATWSYLKLGAWRNYDENLLQSWRKISSNSKFPSKKGWCIWRSWQHSTPWIITIKLQHLDTNLHNLSSSVNILNFGKSNAKLHFFGPLSRFVRTLISTIFSSELPKNTKNIHTDRKVCNFLTIFHISW